MIIETFTVNPFQQNTFAIFKDRECVLIDAGFSKASEINLFTDALREHKCELKAIWLTHAHIDHVIGVQRIIDRYDVPVFLSHRDLYLWQNYYAQASFYGLRAEPFDFIPNDFAEKDPFKFGAFKCTVLETPGHSPDHVSFYFPDENVLFAGDTLFDGSIGRTDLYKGNFQTLENVIKTKLYTLPEQTRVFSGHGGETLIGQEKEHNQFVRA